MTTQTSLNLFPLELQRQQLVQRRIRQGCLLWTAGAMALALWVGWEWRRVRAAVVRCEGAEGQYAPTLRLQEENKRLAERIQTLQKRESLALALANERSMLSLLGLVSRASQAAEGRVVVETLHWGEGRSGLPAGSGPSANLMGATLRLEGVGHDNFSIARFAAALRAVDVFSQVRVNASNANDASTPDGRTYSIECTLTPFD